MKSGQKLTSMCGKLESDFPHPFSGGRQAKQTCFSIQRSFFRMLLLCRGPWLWVHGGSGFRTFLCAAHSWERRARSSISLGPETSAPALIISCLNIEWLLICSKPHSQKHLLWVFFFCLNSVNGIISLPGTFETETYARTRAHKAQGPTNTLSKPSAHPHYWVQSHVDGHGPRSATDTEQNSPWEEPLP